MNNKYPEYKGLNLPEISKRDSESWDRDAVFEASMTSGEGAKPCVF